MYQQVWREVFPGLVLQPSDIVRIQAVSFLLPLSLVSEFVVPGLFASCCRMTPASQGLIQMYPEAGRLALFVCLSFIREENLSAEHDCLDYSHFVPQELREQSSFPEHISERTPLLLRQQRGRQCLLTGHQQHLTPFPWWDYEILLL